MITKTWQLTTILFAFSLAIYFATSAGDTAFNHFTLLADSFRQGKIYIEGDMPWLEKIPIDESKFYVANPPMPAVVSVLPVLLFGKNYPQQYIAHIVSALLVIMTSLVAFKIKNNIKLAIWSGLLVGFGTLNWYLATVGSTWYLAHLVAQLFLTIAILLLIKNKSPLLIGFFIGCAYFSRIPTILALPFFLFNLPRPFLKNLILLGLGILPLVLTNFLYNYARFGVIWDIGYTMIPGVATESWYAKGLVHPDYIREHLKIIFTSLPSFEDLISLNKPSLFGYAIWFTTPAFIYSLFNNIKSKTVWSSWIGIILISLLIFSHGSTGFSQFGYRFAADFYPILIFLTILGVSNKKGPGWLHWLFLFTSILVNLWGVLLLNNLIRLS